jgi:hypothetical protein
MIKEKKGKKYILFLAHINYCDKQPPLIIEHEKRLRQISLEIDVVSWDRHKNGVGLNGLTGSQPSHLDNWISRTFTSIIRQYQISLPFLKFPLVV